MCVVRLRLYLFRLGRTGEEARHAIGNQGHHGLFIDGKFADNCNCYLDMGQTGAGSPMLVKSVSPLPDTIDAVYNQVAVIYDEDAFPGNSVRSG